MSKKKAEPTVRVGTSEMMKRMIRRQHHNHRLPSLMVLLKRSLASLLWYKENRTNVGIETVVTEPYDLPPCWWGAAQPCLYDGLQPLPKKSTICHNLWASRTRIVRRWWNIGDQWRKSTIWPNVSAHAYDAPQCNVESWRKDKEYGLMNSVELHEAYNILIYCILLARHQVGVVCFALTAFAYSIFPTQWRKPVASSHWIIGYERCLLMCFAAQRQIVLCSRDLSLSTELSLKFLKRNKMTEIYSWLKAGILLHSDTSFWIYKHTKCKSSKTELSIQRSWWKPRICHVTQRSAGPSLILLQHLGNRRNDNGSDICISRTETIPGTRR